MKLMKYCISPSKLAWLRKELGKDANGLIAAMDAAGTAYLDKLNASTEALEGEPLEGEVRAETDTPTNSKTQTQRQAQRQLAYLWLQQRIALATRIDDADMAALAAFEFQQIHIEVVQPSEFDAVVTRLQAEQVLGFDTETRASFERGVQHPLSLIQIATADACYLFQHAILGEQFTQLKTVLEDENILKVGVGLRSDAQALKRQWGINVASKLDLNWALAQLGAEKEMGTRQLVATLLGTRIDKPKKIHPIELAACAIIWRANQLCRRRCLGGTHVFQCVNHSADAFLSCIECHKSRAVNPFESSGAIGEIF